MFAYPHAPDRPNAHASTSARPCAFARSCGPEARAPAESVALELSSQIFSLSYSSLNLALLHSHALGSLTNPAFTGLFSMYLRTRYSWASSRI